MNTSDEQLDSLMRDFIEPQMPSAEIRAKRNERIHQAIFNPKTHDAPIVLIHEDEEPTVQPYLARDLYREK